MLENIFLVVICHLVGDYVLQNDFIAKTKGENWYHLFVHCALYVLPFYICFGFGIELAITFGQHYMIDAFKARYGALNYFEDQVLHYMTCLLLYVA